MTIQNAEIAAIFYKLADLLEIEGSNPFRIRAYRNAAHIIASSGRNIAELVHSGEDLTELPAIGKDLAEKIATIVKTGKLPLLKQVEARTPAVLGKLLQIEGLGPKRVQILYKNLKIKNINDLKKAIKSGRLLQLKGFGEKIQDNISASLLQMKDYGKRFSLADAIPIANNLISYLKKHKQVKQVDCAGSYRRRKETVGDLDILVNTRDTDTIMKYFVKFDEIAKVISKGNTRSTVKLRSGMQVDLRAVEEKSYGACLLYFTGSKAHNIAIRKIGINNGYKINEYGVFKNEKQIAGKTEEEVYKKIQLPYIEPELREDKGEIEAARKGELPKLITLKNIRGDLHMYMRSGNEKTTIAELADKAEELGYEYIAISDYINGLKPKEALAHIREIDRINKKLKKVVVLKSAELDILEKGDLDLPNDVLKELDFTVCSIHSKLNLPLKKQTERIIRAMDNPYFTIFGYQARQPYPFDIEKIIHSASERGCFLELSAADKQLNLDETQCRLAKERQVKIAITTAAHNLSQLENMIFGVYQARRGWLEANDVVNTYSLTKLKKMFKR